MHFLPKKALQDLTIDYKDYSKSNESLKRFKMTIFWGSVESLEHGHLKILCT